MLDSFFTTILTTGTFTASEFVIVTLTAFVCGLIIAAAYMFRNHYSKSFIVTLVLLPAIVELVIIMVNGNIGAGVAVAGAFSLVRFRSVPGRGQEIAGIFLAMAVGLAAGMGYIGIAVMFTVVVSGLGVLMNLLRFGAEDKGMRRLRIMIPENLDYEGRFEEVFNKYLREYTYDEVRTANMGSMYKLYYRVYMKKGESIKALMDEIRERNGNLEVSMNRPMIKADEL